jgi:hypothetical protein
MRGEREYLREGGNKWSYWETGDSW